MTVIENKIFNILPNSYQIIFILVSIYIYVFWINELIFGHDTFILVIIQLAIYINVIFV